MNKKFILVIIVLAAIVTSAAGEYINPSVTIDTGTAVVNDEGVILIPVDKWADTEVGLRVIYENWGTNSNYSVTIREEDTGVIVYSQPNDDGTLGTMPSTPNYIHNVHWMPTEIKEYVIYTEGQRKLVVRTAENPINITPELSIIALTSAGILGLIGLTRMRRKD